MIARHIKARELIETLQDAGIRDVRVLDAIQSVPRDLFVPDEQKHQAWENIALPIAQGQTISQPYIVALMSEALDVSSRDKVLEIGTGSGYQAAILSKLARRVYTIERHRPLHNASQDIFSTLGLRNISAICADGMRGWPRIGGIDQAPFDKIIVTAAAREKPPSALLDQLKPGGTLVCPVGGPGDQVLNSYTRQSEDTYSIHTICAVRFVPLLPDVPKEGREKAA